MLTANVVIRKGRITTVASRLAPSRLRKLRVPPAWTRVEADPDPRASVLVTGFDVAGRKQRLYSSAHVAKASSAKFARARRLLAEWDGIGKQIRRDIKKGIGDEALVASLIHETGIRPGSDAETRSAVRAFGATTLQLRHVKPCCRGVRLQFVGKKGVRQSVLVTDPHLVRVLLKRKAATSAWTTLLFDCSSGRLRSYFKTLGTGVYTPKDFRTARGTSTAANLIGSRKPRSARSAKRLINRTLDRVARLLGNTRAVCRSAYVDPRVLAPLVAVVALAAV